MDEGDLTEQEARELLCEIGRRCYAKNFVEANGGNFSYRLRDGRILATPTMISKGFMEPDDMVVLDGEGNQIGGRRGKTSEILMHLTFYKHRPDVRSVVHAHPRHASAFAVTNTPVPKCVIPEVEIFVGEVPITDYETPGTPKLSGQLMPVVQDFDVFLLANHGAVALGRTIMEAFWRIEILDAYCQVILLARQLGEVTQVTDQHMRELFQIKERLGLRDRRLTDPEAARCDVPAPIAGLKRPRPPWVETPSRPAPQPAPQPAPEPAAAQAAGSPSSGGASNPNDRTASPVVSSTVIASPAPEVLEMITREVFSQLRGRGLL